jgi:hypothetical protein
MKFQETQKLKRSFQDRLTIRKVPEEGEVKHSPSKEQLRVEIPSKEQSITDQSLPPTLKTSALPVSLPEIEISPIRVRFSTVGQEGEEKKDEIIEPETAVDYSEKHKSLKAIYKVRIGLNQTNDPILQPQPK